jgi:UDP-2-acetamido-2,6-beta-L-arabino-hexul-4-ose reductase
MAAGKIIAVTGADGFVGRNLLLRMGELGHAARPLVRASTEADWAAAIAEADAVIHLAGVNRPPEPAGFQGNVSAVEMLVAALEKAGKPIPVLLASSAMAEAPSDYGRSKKAAEDRLLAHAEAAGTPVAIFRLPNVFGKWCRPNYNSAVATFCHNIARDLPITINDPAAPLTLVYIDDVIGCFLDLVAREAVATGFHSVAPVYQTTVGEVAETIRGFRSDRGANRIADVGRGLTRALYATYVSYLPPEQFAYQIASHRDPRGAFSEMLKTRSAGQFSYFNALPGVTRGGHYHHTKTEKFLIVHGEALFRFRHVLSGETHEVRTSAETPTVVETIPGWAHDVTNVGEGIMVSLLWANEVFDRERPDTVQREV